MSKRAIMNAPVGPSSHAHPEIPRSGGGGGPRSVSLEHYGAKGSASGRQSSSRIPPYLVAVILCFAVGDIRGGWVPWAPLRSADGYYGFALRAARCQIFMGLLSPKQAAAADELVNSITLIFDVTLGFHSRKMLLMHPPITVPWSLA